MMLTTFSCIPIFALVVARLWTWKRLLGFAAWIFIAAQLWLTVTNLHWYQSQESLLSPSALEAVVSDWSTQGEIVIMQEEAITPVQYEWFLRWRILAERYPIHMIDPISDFSPGLEPVVLVSASPLPQAFGNSEIYALPQGNLVITFVSPPE
jgi:hypothetical protein